MRALQAEREAERSRDIVSRNVLLEVAVFWRALAADAERASRRRRK